jgi:ribosomal protein L11 methylase PrmA
MAETRVERDPASYRDPSGFIFRRDGVLYRQINAVFADDWRAFHDSGLYGALMEQRLLVAHESVGTDAAAAPGAVDIIRPEPIPFLSFPYEWSFSQLRDAALLTLRAQQIALERGMTLKDASAFNVQFIGSRPILIDSLSFERAEEGAPWVAYRQFCEHFLAPLALVAYGDARAALLMRDLPDGIPVDLASSLLPGRTRLRFGLLSHLHMHAGAQRRAARAQVATDAGGSPPARGRRMSSLQQRALLDSLRRTIDGLRWEPETTWSGYEGTTSYTPEAAQSKRRIVGEMLDRFGGEWAWDIGANTGDFSEIAASGGRRVVAVDSDPGAAELHYRRLRDRGDERIWSVVGDLRAPSPSVGWDLAERPSLFERGNADVVIALALVHHLAIGGNVPLGAIAATFARLAPRLIVEFVPKEDSQVQRMLATREDVFADYSLDHFRVALDRHYVAVTEESIPGSIRTLLALRLR